MSASLNYDKRRPIFISPNQRFSLDESESALKTAYSENKPVLIYIHGRAKNIGEPKKSVSQKIYKGLTKYGVSVIGFTWDADDGGYDISRPVASANDFNKFLSATKYFIEKNRKEKPSLLAHSMGNLILSELALDNNLDTNRGSIIENLILSAPAVFQKRHHKWLNKIGIADQIYVMVNPKDKVLIFAGLLFKPDMLGQDIRKPGVREDKAKYIYLKDLGVNHRYFLISKQNEEGRLYEFYSTILKGESIDLHGISKKQNIKGVPVYRLNSTKKKKRT
ncbi:MAG: alpha/beta hydrolase [Candidatus Thiodiazotropha taylori]|nr:alpha/beta hydrolase [Candidatus Thiodiazotropha endolucinida]MCW4228342.1 alpha/beta hydrolase [Candidatus Thiodiazotropha taylori]